MRWSRQLDFKIPKFKNDLDTQICVLLHRIKTGDSEAKNEFALILHPILSVHSSRYFLNQQDAISNTNWVIAKLLSKIDSFDLSKPPMGFIYTSTVNMCIDEYRKTRNRIKREGAYKSQRVTEEIEGNSDLSNNLVIERYSEELLSPLEKKVFKHKWIEGEEDNVAGAKLGLPLSRYKKLAKNIKDKFYKELINA